MKIAFAGKGGVGKTTLAAWTADYLARQGKKVWLIDADTALSLGQAAGLSREQLPIPLIQRRDIIEERIGSGIIHLNPAVADLPEQLSVEIPGDSPGSQHLLVMGTITNAGGGCACGANALLKALLSHIVLERDEWALIDLEAGVEHLGRGTVEGVAGLVIVSEPSRRGLDTAASIAKIAAELNLNNQALVLNRCTDMTNNPEAAIGITLKIPVMQSLVARQFVDGSVVGLDERQELDMYIAALLAHLRMPVD